MCQVSQLTYQEHLCTFIDRAINSNQFENVLVHSMSKNQEDLVQDRLVQEHLNASAGNLAKAKLIWQKRQESQELNSTFERMNLESPRPQGKVPLDNKGNQEYHSTMDVHDDFECNLSEFVFDTFDAGNQDPMAHH